MKIQVRIERLILEGLDLPHSQRPLFQAAVETELANLLAEGSLAPGLLSGENREALDAGEIQAGARPQPQDFGGRVARAVYGSLGEGGKSR